MTINAKVILILKRFIITIALIIPIIVIYAFFMPTRNNPIPFVIHDKIPPSDEILQASNANVLIIGDRMAHQLTFYQEQLVELISKQSRDPIKIYNWSRKNEGLHRTLHKLKMLKKIPNVVLYHGGSEEFYEKLFNKKNIKSVMTDLKIFKNPLVATLIKLFPTLSRILLLNSKLLILNNIQSDRTVYTDREKQSQIEAYYNIYYYQLEELIQIIRTKKSNLIFSTNPINLPLPPKKVCENSTTIKVEIFLDDVKKLILENNLKTALDKLKELSSSFSSNSQIYYMLAITYLKLERKRKAMENFELSSAYDCDTYRSTPSINSLIIKSALKHNLTLINFHYLVNQHFGINELFRDDIFPLDKYYNDFIILLAKKLIIIYINRIILWKQTNHFQT